MKLKLKKDFERRHREFVSDMYKLDMLLLRELCRATNDTDTPNIQHQKENLQR